jgi:glyoxylase-like metal-dependent hydrolase (beta-lactamase superfamily II)
MQITNKLFLVGSEQFAISHLLDCNCYLLDGEGGVALVDTGLGFGVDHIAQSIIDSGFALHDVSHILITHAHLGHWGGAAKLRELTGAEVWAPAAAKHWMEHPEADYTIDQNLDRGRWPADLVRRPCPPDHVFDDGDTIRVGQRDIRAVVVQGHTKDSTCLVTEIDGDRALFTGDVVFYSGMIGLINAPGSSLDDYRRDMQKLAKLQVDILLPGHSVFVLRNGQKHIDRAIRKLADFVLPEMFFETNEFMWQSDYVASLETAEAPRQLSQ